MIAKIKTKGMHCRSCEKIIENAVSSIEGVSSAESDFAKEETTVEFDKTKTNLDEIAKAINSKGYECHCAADEARQSPGNERGEPERHSDAGHVKPELPNTCKNNDYYSISLKNAKYFFIAGAILFIMGLFWIVKYSFSFAWPEITPNMGLFLIFTVGLLTSFHCIGMCGGFVLSYTTKDALDKSQINRSKFLSHLKYGAGKTITYVALGALFGLLGSFITFTPALKGFAALLAGLFLVVYGLNMLNVFPWLRRLQFKGPKFVNSINSEAVRSNRSPFIIGLLNGLMIACGPLQAMLIYAAGTGSAIQGALSLFVFGIGTLPLMLGFGSVATALGSKFTHKVLKASAFIVILLGIVMVNRGLTLTGSGYDISTIVAAAGASGNGISEAAVNSINAQTSEEGYQEIRMDVTSRGWEPNKFVLKKGVPVRWIINGKELNGCNNAIQVPKLNLNFDINPGIQTIEFTPTESGTISWSCWMGMLKGVFIVKDNIDTTNQADVQKELQKVNVPKGGSCGAGGGGCGCGGGRL